MNPNSAYYLSFNVGYPNAYDRAWGHTGGSIMVHGICSSAGCFSMTDKQIEEIYALARESFAGGQREIQMQSFPFRMTAENLAKHRLDPNMPFWRELKRGADYFEVTKLEPPVGVCSKHYVFATPKSGNRFDAFEACPPLSEDPDIKTAVADKERRDDGEVAALVTKGVKAVRLVYQDGGQNPMFTNRFAEVSRPDALVAGPTEIVLDDSPRARPVAVQVAAAKADAIRAEAGRTEIAKAEPGKPTFKTPAQKTLGGTTIVAGTGKAVKHQPEEAVPATFAAAPSAYAKEEPKSAARSFFDKVLGFASPSLTPASTEIQPAAAVQPPVVPLPPARQAVTATPGPQASLEPKDVPHPVIAAAAAAPSSGGLLPLFPSTQN
jgi:hypothetical protein